MLPSVRKDRRSAKTARAVPMPTGPMVRAIPKPVRKTVKPVRAEGSSGAMAKRCAARMARRLSKRGLRAIRAPTAGWDRHRRRIGATVEPVRKQTIVVANKVRALARRAGDRE